MSDFARTAKNRQKSQTMRLGSWLLRISQLSVGRDTTGVHEINWTTHPFITSLVERCGKVMAQGDYWHKMRAPVECYPDS